MTPEQRAAFIMAQTAMLQAELALMQAANKEREMNGYSIAYGEEQFGDLLRKYEPVLGLSSVIEFFKD